MNKVTLRGEWFDDLSPTASEVHVWAVWLEAPVGINRAYRALLSPSEIAKADKFVFEHLRRSYEVSQGVLRLLLACYLKCPSRDIDFQFGLEAKPALCGDSQIRFNLSHAGGLALYAFAYDCEVGIDVEKVRGMRDFAQVASDHFCPEETAELLSIDDAESRIAAFYRCWTRKEAYVKAVGDGLRAPLNQFQVTLSADEPARFVHIGRESTAASKWTLEHLEPAPGYVAALAYPGRARKVVFRQPLAARELLTS
jgi:4'-phosphopantetheinyl transferase